MKQLYTLALAALLALGGSAAPKMPAKAFGSENANRPARLLDTSRLSSQPRVEALRARSASMAGQDLRPSRAEAGDYGLISDPAGEKKNYTLSGIGVTWDAWFGAYVTELSGLAGIVWGDDNKVYLNQTIMGYQGYVEGTLGADGKTITVQLPQTVAVEYGEPYGEDYDIVMQVSLGNRLDVEDEISYEMLPAEQNVITYTLNDDGSVTGNFDYSFEEFTDDEGYTDYDFPQTLLGLFAFASDDPSFVIYYDENTWVQTYTPFNETAITVPEGVNVDWNWVYTDENGTSYFVGVAFDGNDVYVTGLAPYYAADFTIVGSLAADGKSIVFDNGKYINFLEAYNMFAYFTVIRGEYVYNEEMDEYEIEVYTDDADGNPLTQLTMRYDADSRRIWADEGTGFAITSEPGVCDYYTALEYFLTPVIAWSNPDLRNAAPANPEYLGFYDYSDIDGSYGLMWAALPETADGLMLNEKDMWYNLYVNGQPYVFTNEVYGFNDYGLEGEEITDMPLSFSSMDIFTYSGVLIICVWEDSIETVGLQLFNQGTDGKAYASDLVTSSFASLATALAEGKTIGSVTYYDLQGRRVEKPAKGVYVARTTFTDGTSAVSKIAVR